MEEQKQALIRACELANRDAEIAAVEADFDQLPDEISELWIDGIEAGIDAPSR